MRSTRTLGLRVNAALRQATFRSGPYAGKRRAAGAAQDARGARRLDAGGRAPRDAAA